MSGVEIEEKRDSGESDEVLIERDGKFELVRTSDVQARLEEGHENADTLPGGETALKENAHAQSAPAAAEGDGQPGVGPAVEGTPPPHEPASGEKALLDLRKKQDNQKEENEGSNSSSGAGQSRSPTAVASTELKSTSRVQIATAEHLQSAPPPTATPPKQARPHPHRDALTTSTASLRQQSVRKPRRERTKSAPGVRVSSPVEDEAKLREKRLRNEAAFSAWLSKKNNELSERKKTERVKPKLTEEELRAKREMNQAAFERWLMEKDRMLQEQKEQERLSRPATSSDGHRRSEAFENWLHQKRKQKVQETLVEERRERELEDAAKKADPSVVDQAYRHWLQRKHTQAREEARRKEQYKHYYFSQSRRLKQALTHRFEGY